MGPSQRSVLGQAAALHRVCVELLEVSARSLAFVQLVNGVSNYHFELGFRSSRIRGCGAGYIGDAAHRQGREIPLQECYEVG